MTDAQVPFQREVVVDDALHRRFVRANLRLLLLSPLPWLVLALVLLAGALLVLDEVLVAIPVVGAAVGLGALTPLFTVVFAHRSFRRQLPSGSKLRIGFGESAFVTQGALASSTVAYAMFASARRRGSVVFLRERATRRALLFPGELFTDEDLRRFPGEALS